jgi:hypothetical protein
VPLAGFVVHGVAVLAAESENVKFAPVVARPLPLA